MSNTKNRKVENTVKKIIHDVVHVYSGDIANMFNDYFVDIGSNIADTERIACILCMHLAACRFLRT